MAEVFGVQGHQCSFSCFIIENGFWGSFGYAVSRVAFPAIQAECGAIFAIAANIIAIITTPIFEDLIDENVNESYWAYRTVEVVCTAILAMAFVTALGFSFPLPLALGLMIVKLVAEDLIFEG